MFFIMQNQTNGLFGNWSFDIQDDFTRPDGQLAGVNQINNNEAVHKDFGIHCKSALLK